MKSETVVGGVFTVAIFMILFWIAFWITVIVCGIKLVRFICHNGAKAVVENVWNGSDKQKE